LLGHFENIHPKAYIKAQEQKLKATADKVISKSSNGKSVYEILDDTVEDDSVEIVQKSNMKRNSDFFRPADNSNPNKRAKLGKIQIDENILYREISAWLISSGRPTNIVNVNISSVSNVSFDQLFIRCIQFSNEIFTFHRIVKSKKNNRLLCSF
jgi:hypothetical protein